MPVKGQPDPNTAGGDTAQAIKVAGDESPALPAMLNGQPRAYLNASNQGTGGLRQLMELKRSGASVLRGATHTRIAIGQQNCSRPRIGDGPEADAIRQGAATQYRADGSTQSAPRSL